MRILLAFILMPCLLGGVIFGSAGRIDLPFVWAYIGIMTAAGLAAVTVMDRDLMRERLKPGAGGRDRHLRLVVAPFFLAHLVIAGLDLGRWHLSDTVPDSLRIAGLAGLAFAMAIPLWAIGVNRFFSPVVRIQEERGHALVTAGPYRFVRHPGYLGALLSIPFGGLGLGSWWSLAPLAVLAVLILRRTVIEDRFLLEHLDGYRDYAGRVRWRLVPGLW